MMAIVDAMVVELSTVAYSPGLAAVATPAR